MSLPICHMSRKVPPPSTQPTKQREAEDDFTNGDDFPTNRQTPGGKEPLDQDFKDFLLNDPKLQMFEQAIKGTDFDAKLDEFIEKELKAGKEMDDIMNEVMNNMGQ